MISSFTNHIGDLIGNNRLEQAMQEMQTFLKNSPLFYEIIHQSGRYQSVIQEIRRGTVSFEDRQITENQVRFALLQILQELEDNNKYSSEVRTEMTAAAQTAIQHHGHGDIVMGDKGGVVIKGNQGSINELYGRDHNETNIYNQYSEGESTSNRSKKVLLISLITMIGVISVIILFWFFKGGDKTEINNPSGTVITDPKGDVTIDGDDYNVEGDLNIGKQQIDRLYSNILKDYQDVYIEKILEDFGQPPGFHSDESTDDNEIYFSEAPCISGRERETYYYHFPDGTLTFHVKLNEYRPYGIEVFLNESSSAILIPNFNSPGKSDILLGKSTFDEIVKIKQPNYAKGWDGNPPLSRTYTEVVFKGINEWKYTFGILGKNYDVSSRNLTKIKDRKPNFILLEKVED